MPEDGEKEAWWPMLAARSAETPKVIARLPFVPNPEGSFADLGALVIGNITPEASGEDNALLVLMLAEEAFSFARLRSEEHTSELQSLMRISYAVFCLKKKKYTYNSRHTTVTTDLTDEIQLCHSRTSN